MAPVKTPIRLLAVDLDGTLLNAASELPAANRDALLRAHQRGVEIILVTGRRHRFALPIARSLGIDLWLISSNGAITRSLSGETFHRDLLPAPLARDICAVLETFRQCTILTFDLDTKGALVIEGTDGFDPGIQRWMERNAEWIACVPRLEDALVSDPVQVACAGSVERMRRAEERLLSGELDGRITILKTRYPARDLSFVDVLRSGCSKGHALERWATHRGLRREEVMAIGDNYNDIEMLEFAGVPVVMANADDELKQNGWATTLSNEQDGVAAAVREFIG
ncbi:MAG: Cof-type HAD-IIB family hydrolase [Terriglobales bacterium]